MRRSSSWAAVLGVACVALAVSFSACSSGRAGRGSGGDGGTGSNKDGSASCPTGVTCDSTCPGSSTSISGKVYDPAMKNGLYNVTVYVPANALTPLPKGVPTGSDACSCAALFPSGAYVSTTTAEDGTFTLPGVPSGSNVPLVIQIGKWRRSYHLNVTACSDNPQPDKSVAFLGTIPAGDTDDNIPDIAVSTGGADTLECLMRRIGLPTTEYVAGTGTTGHVHMFSGGPGNNSNTGNSNYEGSAEDPTMAGAPESDTSLWSSQAQLMPYDIVLLSCEGDETWNANPAALEAYLNAGGRAFASHYHYAWFAGVIDSGQSYSAPSDWGTHLASWSDGNAGSGGGGGFTDAIGGIIDQTLNGSMAAFPKGVSLMKWMSNLGALGAGGVPSTEVSIYQARYDAVVSASNTSSQPWITSDSSGSAGATLYFSFDTPVNAAKNDAGVPNYCGRAVFSDLHVAGDPSTMDNQNGPPPDGCVDADLSPQEKVLEFMLFDLSSCVLSDSTPPPTGVPIQ